MVNEDNKQLFYCNAGYWKSMKNKFNKHIVLLDNYDSFTYNLAQLVEVITGQMPLIVKNDECTIAQLAEASHLILSPGPGLPGEAGILKQAIEELGPSHKILGVCLGFQAIGEVYGGQLKNLPEVYHGIQSEVYIQDEDDPIVGNLSSPFLVGRYHSWVIDPISYPPQLSISAIDEKGEIMAGKHREYSVYGVQFHPESFMTPEGKMMVSQFLSL